MCRACLIAVMLTSCRESSRPPKKRRVATKQGRQRGRRGCCCHVECVTHVYCTKRGRRNVLNYCIALHWFTHCCSPRFQFPVLHFKAHSTYPVDCHSPCRPLGTAFCRQCSCEVLSTNSPPPSTLNPFSPPLVDILTEFRDAIDNLPLLLLLLRARAVVCGVCHALSATRVDFHHSASVASCHVCSLTNPLEQSYPTPRSTAIFMIKANVWLNSTD